MHIRREVFSELFKTAVYLFPTSQEDKDVTWTLLSIGSFSSIAMYIELELLPACEYSRPSQRPS